MSKKNKVLVIGAGISGLAAAKDLNDSGYDVTILEAKDRIGGRLYTDRSLGVPLEVGANWIHDNNPETNPIMKIKKELGLKAHKCSVAGPAVSFEVLNKEGNKIEISGKDLEKIEFRIGIFAYLAKYLRPSTNISEIFTFVKKLGLLSFIKEEALFVLIQKIALEQAEDPENVSIEALFEQEGFGDDEAVIGGFDQIAYYFEKELHNKIILNSPIEHINYEQDTIKVISGNEKYEANAVIVTASLGALKKEVIKFTPELPIEKKQSIKKLGWGTLNKVILKFENKFWSDTDFIVIANKESNFHAWINEEPVCKEPVIVANISGKNAKKFENKTDEEVVQIALNELKAVYGNKVSELNSYYITKWSLDPYIYGSYSTNKAGENSQLLRKQLSTPVNSKLFFAGEATSVKVAGYLQMALQSGVREAENIKKLYPN
tara:strand:+ start:187 stop:1485 length:1299 start_codon:yes stop_codon:yes gene_type:complete